MANEVHAAEQVDGSELVDTAPNSTNADSYPSQDVQKVLYLYSGPRRDEDGFSTFCKANGFSCDYVDKEYDDSRDLLDQQVWEEVEKTLPRYEGYLMSPPCSTFTAARSHDDGGPRPLRKPSGPERYGIKDAKPYEKEKIRQGTLLGMRAHQVADYATEADKPWILEQPHWREGKTSLFTLDEFQELLSRDNVGRYTVAQCRYGADAEKLTDLISNRDLSSMELRCNHPDRWWRVPWNGQWHYGPHPPLKGKQKAVPAEEWQPSMLRRQELDGPYITRAYAAYPGEFNKALADKMAELMKASKGKRLEHVPENKKESATDSPQVDTRFTMSPTLRVQQQGKDQDSDRWSPRTRRNSMTHKMKVIGKQIGNLIERSLAEHPQVERTICENFGRSADEVEAPTQWLDELRNQLVDLLQRNRIDGQSAVCDQLPIKTDHYETVVRGRLLEYWAQIVQDPAASKYEGAPAGLAGPIELQGVCAEVDDDSPQLDESQISTDFDNFENYSGVEDSQDAMAAIASYRDKGYLHQCENLTEVRQLLGAEPVLSKLGCIVKEKYNAGAGRTTKKVRIILDCKQSLVSKFASRHHKSVLPRVTDAVQAALKQANNCIHEEGVSLFIADVSDAFWLVPLRQSERRFFVARLGGRYFIFLRAAQGSRGAPLTFAVLMALASRFVQSVLCTTKRDSNVPEGLMQVYVDDPLAVLMGTKQRRSRLAAMIAVAWMLLGIPMAFHKAVLAETVVWIGVTIAVTNDEVTVEVTESKVQEIKLLIAEVMQHNVVASKKLRTLIGKCMSIASVIYVWKPFIQELYAALNGPTQAPTGCAWTNQIMHPLKWLMAFLDGEAGTIRRTYSVVQYFAPADKVQITWDASPFGMGVFWTINGRLLEYFAIEISDEDQQILQMESGSCNGQQIWERLSGLFAMQQWASHWKQTRVHLYLRGDNVSALVLFATLKTQSKSLALIAREFALDLGTACYKPEVVQRLPGIANVLADTLSRKYDPGKTFVLHPLLTSAAEVCPPPRPITWWRSLAVPSMPDTPLAAERAWTRKRPRLS